MVYVIDAFNLIYKLEPLEENMYRGRLEDAMRGLTQFLQRVDRKVARSRAAKARERESRKSGGASAKGKGKLSDGASNERRLPAAIEQAAKTGGAGALEWHVFFDGKRRMGDETRQESVGGMQLYYSHDLSADYLIEEFLKRAPSPGEVLVVSSDKKVQDAARRKRCKRMKSEEFAAWARELLEAKARPTGPEAGEESDVQLSEEDVAFWAEQFRKR